eukprot:6948694-Pyramimonas_sp.AAC.1
MGTSRLEVAYQPMKAFVTRSIPLGNLSREHAYWMQKSETTTTCQIKNLHQYTRRALAENALVGIIRL